MCFFIVFVVRSYTTSQFSFNTKLTLSFVSQSRAYNNRIRINPPHTHRVAVLLVLLLLLLLLYFDIVICKHQSHIAVYLYIRTYTYGRIHVYTRLDLNIISRTKQTKNDKQTNNVRRSKEAEECQRVAGRRFGVGLVDKKAFGRHATTIAAKGVREHGSTSEWLYHHFPRSGCVVPVQTANRARLGQSVAWRSIRVRHQCTGRVRIT